MGELREESEAAAVLSNDLSDLSLDRDTAEETLRKDLASEFCDLRLVTVESGVRALRSELTVSEPEALGTE